MCFHSATKLGEDVRGHVELSAHGGRWLIKLWSRNVCKFESWGLETCWRPSSSLRSCCRSKRLSSSNLAHGAARQISYGFFFECHRLLGIYAWFVTCHYLEPIDWSLHTGLFSHAHHGSAASAIPVHWGSIARLVRGASGHGHRLFFSWCKAQCVSMSTQAMLICNSTLVLAARQLTVCIPKFHLGLSAKDAKKQWLQGN